MSKKKSQGPAVAAEPVHPLAACEPLGDRLVVKRDVPKHQTEGGILLPDSSEQFKRQTAEVTAVGPDVGRPKAGVPAEVAGRTRPRPLAPGDRVIITSYAGLEIKDPLNAHLYDDDYLILREEDVLARLPKGWKE